MNDYFNFVLNFVLNFLKSSDEKKIEKNNVLYKIDHYNSRGMAVGELIINHGNTHSVYAAISGPYGNGAIPEGEYQIKLPYTMIDNGEVASYQGDDFAWVAPLSPLFESNRTGLLIHPDGGITGTRGCIGVTKSDTDCFNSLSNIFDQYDDEITLLVIDQSQK